MSAPFSLSLKRSRALFAASLVLHVLPMICGVLAGMSVMGLAGLFAALLVSAVLSFREARGLANARLTLVPHGVSMLAFGGLQREVVVLPVSVDLGWLVLVVWRESGTGRVGRATLTRDAVCDGEWRALRRFLRWELAEASQVS